MLIGLLSLTHRYSRDQIERACDVAATHGAIRLRTIRQLLQRGGSKQQQFEFIDEHPIIRQMADYQAVVQASLGSGPAEETKAL